MNLNPIREHLNRLRREIFMARSCEMAFTFVKHMVVGLVLILLLDIAVWVNVYSIRIVLLLLVLAWSVYQVLKVRHHPIYKELSEIELARVFERRYPDLEGSWVSSLEYENRADDPLIKHLIEESFKKTENIKKESMVVLGPLKKTRAVSMFVTFLLTMSLIFIPQMLIAAQRLYDVNLRWQMKNELITKLLENNDYKVAKNENFVISSIPAKGKTPPSRAELVVNSNDGKDYDRYDMTKRKSGEFYVELKGLRSDSTIVIKGGDFTSIEYKVHVVERPSVVKLQVSAIYPSYINLAPEVFSESTRQFEAIENSEITLLLTANKKLAKATLESSEENSKTIEMTIDGNTARCKKTLLESGVWRIRLTGSDGFKMKSPLGLNIEALKDQTPTVEVFRPSRDIDMGKKGFFLIQGTSKDDFGVKSVELHEDRTNLKDEITKRVVLLHKGINEREQKWEYLVDISKMKTKARIGEVFKYKVVVYDHKGQMGVGRQIAVNVVSEEQLIDDIDELQSRIKAYLDKMKEVEKSVIIFTKGVKADLDKNGVYNNNDMSSAIGKQNTQSKVAVKIMDIGHDIMTILKGNKIKSPQLVKAMAVLAQKLIEFDNILNPKAVKTLAKLRDDKLPADADKAIVAEVECLKAIEALLDQLEFAGGIVSIIEDLNKIIKATNDVKKATDDEDSK